MDDPQTPNVPAAARADGDARRRRWERRAEWPLAALALVFLAAYAWPILDPTLPSATVTLLSTVAWATWALFAVDYLVRLALSRERWRFVRSTPLDLAIVVLPMFRPLRLLRLVTLLSVLNRSAGEYLRGRVAAYVTAATAILLLVSSLAVLDAERAHPGALIVTFGDAIWWSVATVTTVGYGDLYPVTTMGRFVATGLMIAGIALLGVVTASVATWFLARVSEIEEEAEAATRRDIRMLTEELRALRSQLPGSEHSPAGQDAPGPSR